MRVNWKMVLLNCLNINGNPKYSLPSFFLGTDNGYLMFWRPSPCEVIHHVKKRTLILPSPEFVAVGIDRYHCVSISVDREFRAIGGYININLPAEKTSSGWSWRDLELDVLVRRGPDSRWRTTVLDIDEYFRRDLTGDVRQIAEHETFSVIDRVCANEFPFVDLHDRYDLPAG